MAVNRHKTVTNLRGANKEAQARYLGDAARRERAANILRPHEVAGDYDAGRMLGTTLGGEFIRPITHEDLKAFRKNVITAGKQFKGGITAKDVINLSLPQDRELSNKQIRTAVPVQTLGGRIHFMTNASPGSDVARHHVHIELLSFAAAVAMPSKLTDAAKTLATGPLKIDCDCGRHTFWFRYIATIGGFNAGRPESGFPKQRNPGLVGVACKHVLRVMVALSTPSIRLQLEKMIARARDGVTRASKLVTTAEADDLAKKQEKTAHYKRHQVESSADRAARLAMARNTKAVVEKVAKAKATSKKAPPNPKQVAIEMAKLMKAGVISPAQHAAIMAALK